MVVAVLAHFPADPAFGNGIYRRRLLFAAYDGGVAAQVSDTHHGYWLDLHHDRHRVIAVDAGFLRAPTTVCPGAVAGLTELAGLPLEALPASVLARTPTATNCTHLRDLAIWAIAHVGRSAGWDIAIPDRTDSPTWVGIARDGVPVHRWQVLGDSIIAPDALRGRPVMQGFAGWAGRHFAGDNLLAATMLQRGIFVSRGREHIVDRPPVTPLAAAQGMAGMCWAYSDDRLASAHGSIGYVRDFTTTITMDEPPEPVARRFREMES